MGSDSSFTGLPSGAVNARPGEVCCGTVVAPDLGIALPVWTDLLEHKVVYSEPLDPRVASSWGTPAMAGCAQRVLMPASGAPVYVRLIESAEASAGFIPTRSYGWVALEITVEDADRLHERLQAAGLEIVGEPKELSFTDKLYPMQAMGRANELLYLNEVRGNLTDFDLPIAQSFVDRIFIVVLATPDLEASLTFYEEKIGFDRGNEYVFPYGVVNRAFDLPEDVEHRLAMACLGRTVNVEIDQYPPQTVERPRAPGHLPGGIASIGMVVESLERMSAEPLGAGVCRPEPPYDGRRAVSCRGAAGEWIELFENG